MRKKKRTIRRSPGRALTMLLTAFALMVSLGIAAGLSAEPSHAASYTVTGKYVTENFGQYDENWPSEITVLPPDLKTTFSLYKVGHYSHDSSGKSIIVLEDAYSDITLPTVDKDDPGWTKEWLSVAQSISNKLVGDAVSTDTDVAGNQSFTLSAPETGLYLVTGSSTELKNASGQDIWWRPQPMLVQVFDGSARELQIKPEADIAHNFRVTKSWASNPEDKDAESQARPESVTVKIYYDKANNPDPEYTEQLNEENGWSFAWSGKKGKNDPFAWTVEEQKLGEDGDKYYTYSVEPVGVTSVNDGTSETDNDSPEAADISNSGKTKIFKLTNTFEPATLKLTKKLDNFLKNSDNVSTSFVFEVTGYKMIQKEGDAEAKETRVYHKFVALQFDADGNLQNDKTVKYIPAGLTRLTVKEISASNYNVDKAEKEYIAANDENTEISFENGVYTVSFENTYNDKTQFEGGVINKFKLDLKEKKEDAAFKTDGTEGKSIQK